MAGTFEPAQMFDHELNPLKGWPSPYAVDFEAEYADGVTGVYAGMGCSLDANGNLVKGMSAGAMCIFIFQNRSDFDVLSDVGNIAGGVGSGLVACGAYELQSTEFDADTYAPNDALRVGADGLLEKGTVYTDEIVGVVSRGQSDSEHDATIKLLAFWPVWLPAVP
jgi:hypothetical protein